MKKNIHPQWYPEAKVICSCGHTLTTGSTSPELHTELCSACHPFFTGKEKLVDTEGLVEKFKKRQATAEKRISQKKVVEEAKKEKTKKEYRPKTLKEMLDYASKKKV